jgi:hypothetical protein
MPFTAIPSAVVLRWDLSTLGFEHCRLLGLNCGVLLQASCTLSAQSRLSTALLGSARDCDSAADFIFTFGVGSDPVLPVFGPVGFRPRPRSISPTTIYKEIRNRNVSLLLETNFTLRPILPFYFSFYYLLYVLYIYFYFYMIQLREEEDCS